MTKKEKTMPFVGKPITFEEAVQRAKEAGHTHDYVQANYAKVVAEVEAEYGPQVPAMVLRRGRPRKGEVAETVQVKSIKMTPDFWEAFEAQAENAGLNMHAAMRAALVEWADRHRAS